MNTNENLIHTLTTTRLLNMKRNTSYKMQKIKHDKYENQTWVITSK